MPTPNPDYAPQDIEFQKKHGQLLDALRAIDAKADSELGLSPEERTRHAILTAQTQAGHERFLNSFYTTCPTIQDYARLVLRHAFPPTNFPVAVDDLNLDLMTTREGVETLFKIYTDAIDWYKKYTSPQQLPAKQPDGLSAFSDPEHVRKLNLKFNLEASRGIAHTHSTVIIDERDGKIHFCLTYIPQSGTSILVGIEEIATQLLMQQRIAADKEGQPLARPEDCLFYAYAPPQSGRELFTGITMSFTGEEYRFPNFQHYPSVPEVVKQTATDLMQNRLSMLKAMTKSLGNEI